ncbi:MAG: cytochrome C [Desulfuromonadales bacterium]|nr:cytochrome C [Desulfuromonadales bacterium]
MKKFLVLTIALVLMSTSAFAALSGSSHDFTTGAINFDTEICAPCHTPHNSYAPSAGGPLWAHTPSADTFTEYTSATFQGGTIAISGISLACLSCHDGTVALDSYIGGAGTAGTLAAGLTNLTQDLTNDHPVSFNYDTSATADAGIHDRATALTNSGSLLVFYGTNSDQMECATCHDVHNAATVPGLLRYSNAASAMCLDCHNK